MSTTSATAAALACALASAGCVSYEPLPLDGRAELAALARRDVADVVLERARAGAPPAAFDPTDGLDEAETVAVALTLNPELAAKRAEIGAARALLVEAGVWPNPEIDAAWRPGLGAAGGFGADVDLLAALLRPGERSAKAGAAQAEIDRVRADVAAAEARLVRETRLARLDVLFRGRETALLGEETSLREKAADVLRRGRADGAATELDLSAAELELAEVRRDRRGAQTELDAARRALDRLLGLPPGRAVRLTDADGPLVATVFDDVSDDELDRRVLAGRFELRALEAAYARAEEELRLAVLRQFPTLKLGPSFERDSGGDKFLGLGAGIELPLFDRNQGGIAEKYAQRDQARAAWVALLHELRAQAFDAREKLRRARAEIEVQAAEVLPLVEKSERLFGDALRARDLNVMDWIAAQGRVLRARRSYLETVVRYRADLVEFEAATGLPSRAGN